MSVGEAKSQQAVEKLMDSIPRHDNYALGDLEPILAGFRDMEQEVLSVLLRNPYE